MVRLKDAHTHPHSGVDAFPADTSAQALVPLDAQALQTPNAEKCLTEQHTYSKHCLIHVLKSHLQAYFPSSDINHCKYVLINKATQTDCLFHPYHTQVTGQHPGERRFPAHLSPPRRTPAQVDGEKQWETCHQWHGTIQGYISQRKAVESIAVPGVTRSCCTAAAQGWLSSRLQLYLHLLISLHAPPNIHPCEMRSPQAGTGEMKFLKVKVKYFPAHGLHTYVDNESRSAISFYVLTLNV